VLYQNEVEVVLFLVVRVQLQGVLDTKRQLFLGVQSNLTTTNELLTVVL